MFFTNTTAGLALSLFWCYLGVVKETVLVFDDSSQTQEAAADLDRLSEHGVQHVLVSGNKALSGQWVRDVVSTGMDSWRPLHLLMTCSLTCVTAALTQASRLQRELGTQSAFGMTSRWMLMTTGSDGLLEHLLVANITMDNVVVINTSRLSSEQLQTKRLTRTVRQPGHSIYTLVWTQQQRRAWEPVQLQRSRCRGDASSAQSSPGYKALPVPAVGPGEPGPKGLLPNTTYGYHGRRLRVLVKEWVAFVKPCDQPGGTAWCGLTMDLLDVARETFNFTYELVDATDDVWGPGTQRAPHVGYFGRIFRHEVDIGLAPAAHIAERSTTLDFSDTILFSKVVMIYRKPEVTQNPMVLFSALSVRMIAAILGSLVIVTALMAALDMACEFWGDEDSAVVAEVARATRVRKQLYRWLVTLDRTMRVTVAAILSEASELQPHSRPARMLLWSWWMLSVVVAAAFSGTLTAVLSVSRQPQIFSSLEDLVVKQHGYKWGTFRDASIYILLRNSNDSVLQALWAGMERFASQDRDVLSLDINVLAHKVLSEDFVLIVTTYSAGKLISEICGLEIMPVDLRRNMFGLVFPKGSSLTRPFSQTILRLQSSGLLSQMTDKWFPRATCPPTPPGPVVISLLHMQGVMLVLPVGLGVALLVILLEVIYAKRQTGSGDQDTHL